MKMVNGKMDGKLCLCKVEGRKGLVGEKGRGCEEKEGEK